MAQGMGQELLEGLKARPRGIGRVWPGAWQSASLGVLGGIGAEAAIRSML